MNFKGVYYKTFGNDRHSPVLFLHGFMGNNREWSEIIEIISAEYYCIALDLPGHGKSKNPELLKDIWNFNQLSQTINELLEHLSIQKIAIVGYSMGGRIAQHFVTEFPDKLNKLILESSSPGLNNVEERTDRFKKDQELALRLQNDTFKYFLESWYDQPIFSGIKQHPNYARMISWKLLNDPILLAKALTAYSVGNQPYFAQNIAGLQIPVLLICGEKDLKYLGMMQKVKQENPEFKIAILNHCGHNTHFEKPILFAEHLTEFLSL